jgi:heme exporter protein A
MRLSANGLTCLRGGREVFANLDFEVAAGEALTLTGRNGAGKSSLLRMIAGLLAVAKGRIVLDGGDSDLSTPEQSHYLGHRDALKTALTVSENLDFWRSYLGGGAPEKSAADKVDALAAVGLSSVANLPAAYLSAGQRRRLSIARLIAVPRPIWLLDEPTSALDAAAQTMLTALMTDHLKTGGIVIAATHGPLGLLGAQQLHIGGGR